MKALAFVTQTSHTISSQWQFDKIMTAIAFDLEVDIVFLNNGLEQITNNQLWSSLDFYGIENVYYFSSSVETIKNPIFKIKSIDQYELKKLVKQAELFI